MSRTLAEGNVERARKIAQDYRGNPELQHELVEMIERMEERRKQMSQRLAELQKSLGELPPHERALNSAIVAGQLAVTDRKAALKLLDDASEVVQAMKPGKKQIEAELGLAIVYCSVKSDRGFDIMQAQLPALNDLVMAAAKLDGYDQTYLREGEWNMSSSGSLGELLTGLSQNAAYFAWCDFDRAVNLAGQFERPELRLMAQLKLAQGVLAGPPGPWPGADPYLRF